MPPDAQMIMSDIVTMMMMMMKMKNYYCDDHVLYRKM